MAAAEMAFRVAKMEECIRDLAPGLTPAHQAYLVSVLFAVAAEAA